MVKKIYKITKVDANQRADKYIQKVLSRAPRSFIYRQFRRKDIKINDFTALPQSILVEGDELSIFLTDQQLKDFSTIYVFERIPMTAEIIYEDDAILVLDKPRGLLVHSTRLERVKTLTNEVLTYLESKGEFDPSNRGFIPSPVHRLDQETTGLIIFAKTLEIAQVLSDALVKRDEVVRKYYALCSGKLQKEGEIKFELEKDEETFISFVKKNDNEESDRKKEAITKYKAIKYFKNITFVEIHLITGRFNQIRAHFSAINHPLLGDHKYGDRTLNEYLNVFRLCLHAGELKFKKLPHPFSYLNKKTFIAELPDDMKEIIEKIR
jgi:23S rRNA pseudouridine955/2504/2580 synthase